MSVWGTAMYEVMYSHLKFVVDLCIFVWSPLLVCMDVCLRSWLIHLLSSCTYFMYAIKHWCQCFAYLVCMCVLFLMMNCYVMMMDAHSMNAIFTLLLFHFCVCMLRHVWCVVLMMILYNFHGFNLFSFWSNFMGYVCMYVNHEGCLVPCFCCCFWAIYLAN